MQVRLHSDRSCQWETGDQENRRKILHVLGRGTCVCRHFRRFSQLDSIRKYGRGDKRYTANVYAAGQALFDANDPTRFITRLDEPFFRPMDSFEKSGQYVDGTVFIEGMVYYKDKWYLYYGCADSKVGMAIYNPKKPAAADPLP